MLSALAVPAVKTWPAGQFAVQAVHDVAVPALATKPDVHGVQVRSALILPAMNLFPAGQSVVRTSHGP